MDLKDLEKMLEVIKSLEPANPTSTKNFTIEKENMNKDTKLNTNDPLFHKPRKSSLPLVLGISNDSQKSLFQNDKSQSNTHLGRLSMLHSNSRRIQKNAYEINVSEINIENSFHNTNFSNFVDENDVYEDFSIPTPNVKFNKGFENIENTFENDDIDTITTEPLHLNDTLSRNNIKLLKMTEIRNSRLSEKAFPKLNVQSEDNTYLIMQSAPQSGRNSIINQFSDYQSSSDSGVGQIISINLDNSSESFSDSSMSNVTTFFEKESVLQNNEFPNQNYLIKNSETPQLQKSDLLIKSEEIIHPKIIPKIKTEEEQNMFLRFISTELSQSSFQTKEIIKFYVRNGSFSSQIVDKHHTASSLCNMLKAKFRVEEETFYQIVEVITKESLERPLEDHENVLEVFNSWRSESYHNRFIFQRNPATYKIFMEPSIFRNEMKCDFQITDLLWIKWKNNKWIHATCSIVDSSIYYILKSGSKDQKGLNLLVNLKTVNFYTCSNNKRIKKEYKSPTLELIVLKESKIDHKIQSNIYLATLNNLQKERWIEAIKVAKYSFTQLKNNYLENQICFPTGLRNQIKSETIVEETLYPKEPCSI